MPEQTVVQYKDDGVEYRFNSFEEECRQAINAGGGGTEARSSMGRVRVECRASSFWKCEPVGAGRRLASDTDEVSQQKLPVGDIDPSAVLEADLAKCSDALETQLLMQSGARVVRKRCAADRNVYAASSQG